MFFPRFFTFSKTLGTPPPGPWGRPTAFAEEGLLADLRGGGLGRVQRGLGQRGGRGAGGLGELVREVVVQTCKQLFFCFVFFNVFVVFHRVLYIVGVCL